MEINFNEKTGFIVKQKKLQLVLKDQMVTVISDNSEPVIISGPGEYEVNSVAVNSHSIKDLVVYVCEVDELRLVYLGELKEKLTDDQRDWLDGVDIMLVTGQSAELVKQISPSIAVTPAAISGLASPVRNESKLIINKLDLPEETEVVILNG